LDAVIGSKTLDNYLTVLQQAEAYGNGYPAYVRKEFERYLACGDLTQGFSRIRREDCKYERLVALAYVSYCSSLRRVVDSVKHLPSIVAAVSYFDASPLRHPTVGINQRGNHVPAL
jgi:hypothetical protein